MDELEKTQKKKKNIASWKVGFSPIMQNVKWQEQGHNVL